MAAHFIFVGPTGFAGASQIMSSWAHSLANSGHNVHFVGEKLPFAFEHRPFVAPILKHITFPNVGAMTKDGAIENKDRLVFLSMTESILDLVEQSTFENIIIWAHYLQPYAISALLAHTMSSKTTRLWVTPTGSDIWEVAPNYANTTRALLTSSSVEKVITYSNTFLEEVKVIGSPHCGKILLPFIEPDMFHHPARNESQNLRATFGIPNESVVLVNHSNMRPIKNVSVCEIIAKEIASSNPATRIDLLLAGPAEGNSIKQWKNLHIHQLGLVSGISEVLMVADIALNTSTHDSLNLSLAEAACCGVPFISTDIVGIREHLPQSDLAVFLDTNKLLSRKTEFVNEAKCAAQKLINNEVHHSERRRRFSLSSIDIFSSSGVQSKLESFICQN